VAGIDAGALAGAEAGILAALFDTLDDCDALVLGTSTNEEDTTNPGDVFAFAPSLAHANTNIINVAIDLI
jgi:hypothetical protein